MLPLINSHPASLKNTRVPSVRPSVSQSENSRGLRSQSRLWFLLQALHRSADSPCFVWLLRQIQGRPREEKKSSSSGSIRWLSRSHARRAWPGRTRLIAGLVPSLSSHPRPVARPSLRPVTTRKIRQTWTGIAHLNMTCMRRADHSSNVRQSKTRRRHPSRSVSSRLAAAAYSSTSTRTYISISLLPRETRRSPHRNAREGRARPPARFSFVVVVVIGAAPVPVAFSACRNCALGRPTVAPIHHRVYSVRSLRSKRMTPRNVT